MLGLGLVGALVRRQGATSESPADAYPGAPPPLMPLRFAEHIAFAAAQLGEMRQELTEAMDSHGGDLMDRQCLVAGLSGRLQQLTVILCTSLFAAGQDDEIVRRAAHVICCDLVRQVQGRRAREEDFAPVLDLGRAIVEGGHSSLVAIEPPPVLIPYRPEQE
jgi:hypothetical protein